jgi:diguanylate cyclase (GGDEF)-like protein
MTKIETDGPERIEELRERLRLAEDRLRGSERQLEAANRQILELTRVDSLTGLANRRSFDEHLAREWARAVRLNTKLESPISLILLDVDHFRSFNEIYGERAGDECLLQLAAVVKAAANRPGDLAARYGGEEFAVILPGAESKDAALAAETIRSGVLELAIPHGGAGAEGRISVSLGVTTVLPEIAAGLDALLAAAHQALDSAKSGGRNRIGIS